MMPAELTVHMELRFAWWWWPYYYGLVTIVALTGMEPNWDKVDDYVVSALRVRFDGGPWQRCTRLLDQRPER